MKRLVAPVKGVLPLMFIYQIINHLYPCGKYRKSSYCTRKGVQLEVHLIDVNGIYGRRIDVVLRKKLRNEQRFASLMHCTANRR